MGLSVKEQETLSKFMAIGVARTTERLEKITRTKWGIMSSSVNEVAPIHLLTNFLKSEERCIGAHFHASSMVPRAFGASQSDARRAYP